MEIVDWLAREGIAPGCRASGARPEQDSLDLARLLTTHVRKRTAQGFRRQIEMPDAEASRQDLPDTLLDGAYRFAEGLGPEYGALDIIPDNAGNYVVIDVNTTPGLSHVMENRMTLPREPWGRDPQ